VVGAGAVVDGRSTVAGVASFATPSGAVDVSAATTGPTPPVAVVVVAEAAGKMSSDGAAIAESATRLSVRVGVTANASRAKVVAGKGVAVATIRSVGAVGPASPVSDAGAGTIGRSSVSTRTDGVGFGGTDGSASSARPTRKKSAHAAENPTTVETTDATCADLNGRPPSRVASS
jgi:hypothetical protein